MTPVKADDKFIELTGQNCAPLPVGVCQTDLGVSLVSCWELTPEEIQEIATTGRIWLSLATRSHPPVRLSTVCLYDELFDVRIPKDDGQ